MDNVNENVEIKDEVIVEENTEKMDDVAEQTLTNVGKIVGLSDEQIAETIKEKSEETATEEEDVKIDFKENLTVDLLLKSLANTDAKENKEIKPFKDITEDQANEIVNLFDIIKRNPEKHTDIYNLMSDDLKKIIHESCRIMGISKDDIVTIHKFAEMLIFQVGSDALMDDSIDLLKTTINKEVAKFNDLNLYDEYFEESYNNMKTQLQAILNNEKSSVELKYTTSEILRSLDDSVKFQRIYDFFAKSKKHLNINRLHKKKDSYIEDCNRKLKSYNLKNTKVDVLYKVANILNVSEDAITAIIAAMSFDINKRNKADMTFLYYTILNVFGATASYKNPTQSEFSKQIINSFIALCEHLEKEMVHRNKELSNIYRDKRKEKRKNANKNSKRKK